MVVNRKVVIGGDPDLAKSEAMRLANEEKWRRMRLRRDAITGIFEKTNRIVTGLPVTVRTRFLGNESVLLQNAPGYTDGQRITFNSEMVEADLAPGKSFAEFVVKWKGVNYHELAHVIYSPRRADPLRAKLRKLHASERNLGFKAYNFLEDQRIETLFTTMYPASTPYFVAAVSNFILSDRAFVGRQFLLIHGRKFIDRDVRKAVRAAFVSEYGEDSAIVVGTIIDKYLRIVLPTHTTQALHLVVQFMEWMKRNIPLEGMLPEQHRSCGVGVGSGDITEGKNTIAAQKDAQSWAEEMLDEEEKLDRKDAQKSKQEKAEKAAPGENDEGEGEGDNKEGNAGDEKGEGEGEESKGDIQAGGDAAGAGEEFVPPIPEKAIKAIEDLLKETMQDKALKDDVRDTSKAVNSIIESGEMKAAGRTAPSNLVPANAPLLSTVRRVSAALRAIKTDLEPVWLKAQPMGRLNTRRLLQTQIDPNNTDVFDMWDEGSEEEATTECVICLDMSGSMGSYIIYSDPSKGKHIDAASEALWILKRAFDDNDVRTTVLGFNSGFSVLYQPNEKASHSKVARFSAQGGTQPQGAIRQAYQILATSQATNKMLVVITDGMWLGSTDTLVNALNRAGVLTVMIGYNFDPKNSHNFDIVKGVKDFGTVVKIINEMAMEFMRRARRSER